MALKFFAGHNCDLVIWETGLGGRLDATNIVTPLASVITNIAFDHTQWLGDTLEKIAAEKAGIIKPGVPVLTAATQPEVQAVIEKFARENNAPLTTAAGEGFPPPAGFVALRRDAAALSLAGEHQKQNAALALATVEILQKQIPVAKDDLRIGMANVRWPGRLQWIQKPDGRKILLDGAHNPAGFMDQPRRAGMVPVVPTLIVGFLGDKDWRLMCEILAPMAAKIFAVPVASGRTADANGLAAVFRVANPAASVTVCRDLAAALNASRDEPFVVVTGSLYLIGEALELLGLSPAGAGERRLNEWSATDSCDKGAAS
jgi:dihydrofolate synthase/folylpolyglutamate synthase